MTRLAVASALWLCACLPAPATAPPRPVLSDVEARAWTAYLASFERLLGSSASEQRGLAILEARAKLAEALAGAEVPRDAATEGIRLLAALDSRFAAVTRPPPPSAPPLAREEPSPPQPQQEDPDVEISEAERDDGGPPVDIVLPPAAPG